MHRKPSANLCLFGFSFAVLLIFVVFDFGCATQPQRPISQGPFTLVNTNLDGEFVQVLKSSFGLKIQAETNYISIVFTTNILLMIEYDPKTLKPESTFWSREDSNSKRCEEVIDLNADGTPDLKVIKGDGDEKKLLFYLGNWYPTATVGTNALITYEGKPLRLFWDENQWQKSAEPRTNKNTELPGPT
jgi:hypothetical protein